MLCASCQGIHFQTPASSHPLLARATTYILHTTRQSLLDAIADGCRFCSLVRSQLGDVETASHVCDELGAYVVLRFSVSGGRAAVANGLRSVGIISRLGNAILDEIRELPEAYATALEEHARACQSAAQQSGVTIYSPVVNTQLARLWRDECLRSHSACRLASAGSSPPASLPTRLLDVTDPDRLLLVETSPTGAAAATATTRTSTTPYVALSYAWGAGARFLTLRDNVAAHRAAGISASALPRTFRDAAHAARALGYGWLWIDALCIVQDDGADVARELARMGDVYRCAEMTLAAQGAASAHAGLFALPSAGSGGVLRPCKVSIVVSGPGFTVARAATLAGVANGPDFLAARGWVLQEEVLSSRALVFAGAQIAWECMQMTARETLPVPRPRRVPLAFAALASDGALARERGRVMGNVEAMRMRLFAPQEMLASESADGGRLPRQRANHFDAWYALVEEYSDKQLTNAGDTLQALGRLSAMFAQGHGTSYLAGLWREDLVSGLAWYVAVNDKREVNDADTRRRVAPSWSWASVGKVRVRYVPTLREPHQPASS
ncbi:heterokaryon incompatibility protein-domain-containing protein [Lasiosphaeria miniovina]|uniref:Heterokaryon incompatibility protein-domain-containing protein n=1 Tax=Lasiosphaeria miniovina TaxID=1954250 RepID=A0AA40A6B1_9PEZI|nr:heterokaryon incompatibility protein-domain-containing protein [Lasiosphaeria miniovina]KAK0710052.1 heterokaryon incompatibility protein-domain-containing protein [Lasiosphaeria miniovina]